MIRKMLKEEWRLHSNIYKGRGFTYFPLMVLFLSTGFSYITLNYSTVDKLFLERSAQIMFGFLGLAVGSVGFSSRSAMKNVLGPVNLIIYSSRTLPVSRTNLMLQFAVKDIIYYFLMLILPISVGIVAVSGLQVLPGIFIGLLFFLAAMIVSVISTRFSAKFRIMPRIDYRNIRLNPLASKSIIDLLRSSGGILKVLFSFTILTIFYWFTVLYFPIAQSLMNNPLISFGIMTGLLSLTVYNWLNRFDDLKDYTYLPVNDKELLKSKKQAFLAISLPLTTGSVILSYYFYRSELFLALLSAVATTLFTLVLAVRITGLKPNEKLFNTSKFLKYLLANSVIVVPLLVFSVFYTGQKLLFTALLTSVIIASSLIIKYKK